MANLKYVKEISKKEFMEQIKDYAINVLGFKKGVRYLNTRWEQQVVEKDVEIFNGEYLASGCGTGLIFEDGEFAEIINIGKEAGATVWEPTMELRLLHIKYVKHQLQQKWVEQNSGAEEWRNIETVE